MVAIQGILGTVGRGRGLREGNGGLGNELAEIRRAGGPSLQYSYGGITMLLYSAAFKIQGSFKGLSRVF